MTLRHAVSDSNAMVRRQFLHMLRYPSMSLFIVGIPIVMLLLFVYVFGGVLGDGLGGTGDGRAAYVNYVTPGVVLLTLVGASTATAVSVAMDMTEGIIARFRTMAIFRPSILTGHVVGGMATTLLGMMLVIGVALLIGFRPTANVGEWFAVAGILTLLVLAVTWLSVALGLAAKGVESASNMPMPLMLLPFLGSGFVPTESMPTALRWFAEYQPFTPIIETMRGLFMGTPIGNSGWLALAWCVGGTIACFFWSRSLFNKRSER